MKETQAQRFWDFVDKTGTCWLWRGLIAGNGYGHVWFRLRNEQAHRLAWILTFGEIPEGQFVLHRCDNPPCVNPDHLFLGTAKDNADDCVRKGRHNRKSISIDVKAAIKDAYAAGLSDSLLAVIFRLNRTTVWAIANQKRIYKENTCQKELSSGLMTAEN